MRGHPSQSRGSRDINRGQNGDSYSSNRRGEMNGVQSHYPQGRGFPENPREQTPEAQRHIYDENGRVLPPLSYFRKDHIAKLLVYGIKEEQGEVSILRRQLFKKYKSALYKLMTRLEYERKMLIRQEFVIRGRDSEKALENSEIMKKKMDEKHIFGQLIPEHIRNRKRRNQNLEDSYPNNGRSNPPNPAEVHNSEPSGAHRNFRSRDENLGNGDVTMNPQSIDRVNNFSRQDLSRSDNVRISTITLAPACRQTNE